MSDAMTDKELKAIEVKSAEEAYRKIHTALGIWIHHALDDGFLDDPLMGSHVTDLIKMADLMLQVEQKIEDQKIRMFQ